MRESLREKGATFRGPEVPPTTEPGNVSPSYCRIWKRTCRGEGGGGAWTMAYLSLGELEDAVAALGGSLAGQVVCDMGQL